MIVLDSSFLVAYHNSRDVHHEAAAEAMVRFLDSEWGHGLLLEYVFLEVVTVLMVRRGPEVAADVADVLLGARELEVDDVGDARPAEVGGDHRADGGVVAVRRDASHEDELAAERQG